jgi:general stress protein YciG
MAEMNNQNTNGTQKKSVRGFAAMDAEKQREIARKGGRAAHEQGVAHEWSSQEAREAGKKGGQARGKQSSRSESPLL